MLFAGNGTIKISLFEFFFFFSLFFELFVVCVLMETCYIDNSRLIEMVQRTRGGVGVVCVCVHLCNCVFVCKEQRMCPSPNDDVKIMKACAWYFSPQGSHVLHANPPVFIACDTSFLHVKWCIGFSMLHNVLLYMFLSCFLCVNRSKWS